MASLGDQGKQEEVFYCTHCRSLIPNKEVHFYRFHYKLCRKCWEISSRQERNRLVFKHFLR